MTSLNSVALQSAESEASQRARFLNNEIKELYWLLLVTCPVCGSILSTDKEINNPYCNHCQATFLPNECPDLFY